MLNISKGKIKRAQKVVIYGSEGIGKSSLAANFPDPLFIDTEGGTSHMDVRRIEKPQSWEEMLAVVKEVAATKDVCKTFVLDTVDWAEQMIVVIFALSTSRTPSSPSATAKVTHISRRNSPACFRPWIWCWPPGFMWW